MSRIPIRHGHLFCGLGGGAKGFNRATARVRQLTAEMQCVGGIDNDPRAIEDFNRFAGGVRGTVLDLFSREQYIAFHGREPEPGWREAMPSDIHRAFHYLRPNILFTSPPCKGNSGLLAESRAQSADYQALNELALRGIWLTLEAYAHDPIEFILLENVPRIEHRSAHFLDQIEQLVRHYGYVCARTTHDCGELGGLAQRRKRFLMVMRHAEKVPNFLYEPARKPLRSVGDVLSCLPFPGDINAGPLHRLPRLQWQTWVRLAFVEAGKDWRSLNRLAVEDGMLRDYAIAPDAGYHGGVLGVMPWEASSGTMTGNGRPATGNFSVADPRIIGHEKSVQLGVRRWSDVAGTVTGKGYAGGGPYSVSDPRLPPTEFKGYRVVNWQQRAGTITGARAPGSSAQSVADPRPLSTGHSKYNVTRYGAAAGTVIGGSLKGEGAFAVADPRPGFVRSKGDAYLTGGHYGVVPWDGVSYTVAGALQHDNGFGSVADPRLPNPRDHLVCFIVAEDQTYHRPFTTLDMGALQSLVDPEELSHFILAGNSDSACRERIGNAVPPDAAEAIGSVMAKALLLAWTGETAIVDHMPIWVRPLVIAAQCGHAGAA